MKVLQFPPRHGRASTALTTLGAILEGYRSERHRLREEGVRLRAAVARLRRQARQFSRTQAGLTLEVGRLRRCTRTFLLPSNDR